MARVSQTTQQITRDGLVPTLTVPTADGDVIDSGQVALYVVNGSASSVDVTAQATATQDGLALEDLVVAVAAGDTALIGPFPMRTFGQPAGANESGSDDQGRVYVDYAPLDPALEAAVVAF